MREGIIEYDGKLDLNGLLIRCYVLKDGTRVLSGREMQRALKMVDDVDDGKETAGTRLARYLSQKSLKDFIFSGKEPGHFEPIICYKGDSKINGYEATVLADICDGFLEARKTIHLSPRQKIIADQCEMLIRSFAKVGIIALIDEATGYQYERERNELQTILKAFISDEINIWEDDTFPLSFYKEIFRLWQIPFTEQNIKRKPQFVGHITNRFVYHNMPKGSFVLEALKQKTPKTTGGNYKFRFHNSLTPKQGREMLKKVIYSVETLASISENKEKFKFFIDEKYGQKSLFSYKELDELSKDDNTEPVNLVEKANFGQILNAVTKAGKPE